MSSSSLFEGPPFTLAKIFASWKPGTKIAQPSSEVQGGFATSGGPFPLSKSVFENAGRSSSSGSRRLFKKAFQRGRSERRGEAYSVPYVEPLSDARKKLEDFFNSLLVFARLGVC